MNIKKYLINSVDSREASLDKHETLEDNMEEPKDVNNYVNKLPEYREKYNNYNIMGLLEIPNINISALIVRTNNNEYYLRWSKN